MILRGLLIAAVVAAPFTLPTVSTAQSAQSPASAAVLSRLAIRDVLLSQSEFNIARAGGDRQGMREAAGDVVNNLAVSQQWLSELDERITATEHSAQLDQDVQTVRGLVDNAYDAVDDFFINDDMEGFGKALDTEAADWLTELRLTGLRVMDEVFAAASSD